MRTDPPRKTYKKQEPYHTEQEVRQKKRPHHQPTLSPHQGSLWNTSSRPEPRAGIGAGAIEPTLISDAETPKTQKPPY